MVRGAICAGLFWAMRENCSAVSCYGETSYNFFQKKLAIACGMCYVAFVQRRNNLHKLNGQRLQVYFQLLLTLPLELCKFVQASEQRRTLETDGPRPTDNRNNPVHTVQTTLYKVRALDSASVRLVSDTSRNQKTVW